MIIIVLAFVVILSIILVRNYLMRRGPVPEEAEEEIFSLVSRVKYPQDSTPGSRQPQAAPLPAEQDSGQQPANIELITGRQGITESLRALADKYYLKEITIATDDGLVFATSSSRDVQIDAVKFSQIARHQAPPDEPDVTLFELMHKESRLIGIIRSAGDLPQNWKRQIRDDTKVILQWWL